MSNQFQQMPVPEYPGRRCKGAESLVNVAALQMEPHIGDKEHNVMESVRLINKAFAQGARAPGCGSRRTLAACRARRVGERAGGR